MKFKKRLFFPFHVAARPLLLENPKNCPVQGEVFPVSGTGWRLG
jgi:hypothetical protein